MFKLLMPPLKDLPRAFALTYAGTTLLHHASSTMDWRLLMLLTDYAPSHWEAPPWADEDVKTAMLGTGAARPRPLDVSAASVVEQTPLFSCIENMIALRSAAGGGQGAKGGERASVPEPVAVNGAAQASVGFSFDDDMGTAVSAAGSAFLLAQGARCLALLTTLAPHCVTMPDHEGVTPLMLGVRLGSTWIVRLLVQAVLADHMGKRPVMSVPSERELAAAVRATPGGAKVLARALAVTDRMGHTALWHAASQGDVMCVRYLVALGAKPLEDTGYIHHGGIKSLMMQLSSAVRRCDVLILYSPAAQTMAKLVHSFWDKTLGSNVSGDARKGGAGAAADIAAVGRSHLLCVGDDSNGDASNLPDGTESLVESCSMIIAVWTGNESAASGQAMRQACQDVWSSSAVVVCNVNGVSISPDTWGDGLVLLDATCVAGDDRDSQHRLLPFYNEVRCDCQSLG